MRYRPIAISPLRETTRHLARATTMGYLLRWGSRWRCLLALLAALATQSGWAQAQTYDGVMVQLPGGTFSMGEPLASYEGPPGGYDAPVHQVTVGPFQMGATEVTNGQYAAFLNAAESAGLIVVEEGTAPPDQGALLVVGSDSAPDAYRGQALVNLSGTRVLKDHDDADGDGDPFTGSVEPENPLNVSYLGYDAASVLGSRFSVKDPRDANDFDWAALTDYYDYTSTPRQRDTSVLRNDFDDWDALADLPDTLPTRADVTAWPATFIRWYGAEAFASFYGLSLPTEAEWEYAARGGADFEFATASGTVLGDGSSANWNHTGATVAPAHVYAADWGEPNPYGLYNLAGNAWEWCADTYSSDFYADATDPVNVSDTGFYVRRGGSWNYHRTTLKAAARAFDEPFKGNDHFGFRVVARGAAQDVESADDPGTAPRLGAIYPNPLVDSGTIEVDLATSGPVRVAVYDLLGREVSVPVDRWMQVGRHTLFVQLPPGYAAGVYVLRLDTATGSGSRVFQATRG